MTFEDHEQWQNYTCSYKNYSLKSSAFWAFLNVITIFICTAPMFCMYCLQIFRDEVSRSGAVYIECTYC